MGNRKQKAMDKKKAARAKRTKGILARIRDATGVITGKAKVIGYSDPEEGAHPLVITTEGEISGMDKMRVGLEPSLIITGNPRSYIPPYMTAHKGVPTGRMILEVFPGVQGCAVLMSTDLIWISQLKPMRGFWGEGQIDVLLDALHPRCRLINPEYQEIDMKLNNRGWVCEIERVHDPNKVPESYTALGMGSDVKDGAYLNREIRVWRPPRDGEDDLALRKLDDVVM